jgi:putative DNA primase/helicase
MKHFGPSARERANGHWREILIAAGVPAKHLVNIHTVCPLCGSTDNKGTPKRWFRFDDKDGRGTYICNACGAGDGFQFLMQHLGTSSFHEAARYVEGYFDGNSVAHEAPVKVVDEAEQARQREAVKREREKVARDLQRAWNEARPISPDDPVGRYLAVTRRLPLSGLAGALRFHPGLRYYEEVENPDGTTRYVKRGIHPVMLGKASEPGGKPVGLHRSYLTAEGKKAPYEKVKKLMKSLGMHGAAIRLYEPKGATLGVAEGIESAIAAHALTGLPVWATISSTIMESFEPPSGITTVVIFADNDAPDSRGKRAGQHAAQVLKERLEARGIKVKVILPVAVGTDFHDVWIGALEKRGAKALHAKAA